MFTKQPIMTLDYVSFDGTEPRNEFELKDKIISEFEKLKSDKAGSINTIGIDRAINIVRRA